MRPISKVFWLTIAVLGPCMSIPPALAEARWTPIAQTEDSVYLLDETSIEVREGLVTAWELVDYA